MTIEEIKNIKGGRNDLRKFGITIGIALGILGGLFLWRAKEFYFYFFILSAAFFSFGIIVPALLKPIYKIWMTLAMLLGWLMTRIILSVLFYLVFTPIGLLARLFGKDFLNSNSNRNADSHWILKGTAKPERSNYERQF